MRTLWVLAALLGMLVSLQAKEADLAAGSAKPRGRRQAGCQQSKRPAAGQARKNKVRWPQGS